ncbi:unnamed protein product [Brachionus calyciflorus]|uniref:Uncharacterized protein n=1 Tax=Brachionus calyciflorus TaxID=104777 RepID=A0A814KD11_9BILA|nr:unnamed protein product [Brachionus calyciflorus]
MTIPFSDEDTDCLIIEYFNKQNSYPQLNLNKRENEKFSVQVVDDFESISITDLTKDYDSIYYNSPLSNYHTDYREEQLKSSLTNEFWCKHSKSKTSLTITFNNETVGVPNVSLSIFKKNDSIPEIDWHYRMNEILKQSI